MTFTPNLPQSGQSLGQTRDPIRDNFTNYNTVVSVDHVAPNAAGQGQHKQVTLNTFGAFPYAAAGTKSFLGAYNASAAGTQLVYQPSVATTYVPCTPRSMARITKTAPGTYALSATHEGPYGSGTQFNVTAPGPVAGGLAYHFASALASTDYFVFVSAEGAYTDFTYYITNKAVNEFYLNFSTMPTNTSLVIMVY